MIRLEILASERFLESNPTKHIKIGKNLGIRERFMAREYTLYIRCFYDREYTIDAIREEIEKSKQYIDDIIKLL